MPSPDSALQALMPSRVSGTLTTMCRIDLGELAALP